MVVTLVSVYVSGWHCSLPAAAPHADQAMLPQKPPSRGSTPGGLVWSNLGTSREVMGSRGGDRLKVKVQLGGHRLWQRLHTKVDPSPTGVDSSFERLPAVTLLSWAPDAAFMVGTCHPQQECRSASGACRLTLCLSRAPGLLEGCAGCMAWLSIELRCGHGLTSTGHCVLHIA